MGLADHTIEAEVAEPLADWVAPPVVVVVVDDDEPPLLQPAMANAPVTPMRAASCQPLGRLPEFLIDRSRTACPPFQ
jgi:hypothetical protein